LFSVELAPSVTAFAAKPYLIERVRLSDLHARLVRKVEARPRASESGVDGDTVTHTITRLRDTPHYQFVTGNRTPYQEYLARFGRHVGFGIEHSEADFDRLLESDFRYLEPPHNDRYIVCERVRSGLGKKLVVLDGVHRACLLSYRGEHAAAVAIVLDEAPPARAQLDQYLDDYKNDFREWYTPIQVGGRVIHERTYPNFVERPEYLDNRERGKSKWDFVIAQNLPDVRGKSVCDIGCNVGLYCLYLAQRGARQVVGYDRGEHVVQPTNPGLPRQDVVDQAYFVRNLFRLANEAPTDNVRYESCDLSVLDFGSLRFDVLFSTCVLYHFGRARFEAIIRAVAPNIPEIFLQTNLGHTEGELGELVQAEYQAGVLRANGYDVVIDAPPGYAYPVLYGRR
jgi:2-polyprenyl-3-methyl-5-hydroxy-6-metoxy-1,4-benzoquinol methylase